MTDAKGNDGASSMPPNEDGVLANLPRTRPQRSSLRRAAARQARSAAGSSETAPARSAARTPDRSPTARRSGSGGPPPKAVVAAKRERAPTRRQAGPRHAPVRVEDAPRQGFDCEGDTASGPVQPPGGAELVASAAEIVVEVARAGLSRSERLLKDVISRLPLS